MSIQHLTEEEIQQFALEEALTTELRSHLNECEQCRERVNAYSVLFSSLHQQPREVFDFNLAEAVMQQLPLPVQKNNNENPLLYFFITLVIGIAAVAIYAFRAYVRSFFDNFAPLFLYLLLTTFVAVSMWLVTDTYKRYKNKMNELNLYNV